MIKIILTVQATGKKWRLGLFVKDSRKYFNHLEAVKFVLSKGVIIKCNAACGTSLKKKSFDFNHKLLSKWITDNLFQKYPPRKPTRLIFKLNLNPQCKVLTFIDKNIGNTNFSIT